ncbi:Txe/YoeB family addiction module toxin [Sphingomonas sp. LT1P40]|uniref:Txe/YoeB family addiction module toxin n=1 Tax=Alteristakelama amylovorans TaxID=3096166 RepID=UPI002FCC5A01
MKIVFRADCWRDYVAWQAEDAKVLERINLLIGECLRHPFSGTGKPEPLKRNLASWWSRRIDREHRLVYRVSGSGQAQALEVLSCRYHY